MGRWLLAAAVVLLPGLPADAGPGGPLRLSARRGPHDDPGVVVIRGARAEQIARVWFGDEPSLAVAPWQGDGLSVAVPPGPAGSRVPVVVEMEDGGLRRVGGFGYDGAIRRGRAAARLDRRLGCSVGVRPDRRFRGAETRSSVLRLGGGRYLYRWDFRNTLTGAVTIRWVTLEHLGFTGGLAFNLAPGERFGLVRESDAPPVLVRGVATVSALPGCPDLDPEGDGEVYESGAFFAVDEVPAVAAVEGLSALPATASAIDIAWQAAPGEPPDAFEVFVRGVFRSHDLGSPPVFHDAFPIRVAAPTTALRVETFPGASTISVRAFRDGVPSEPVVLALVR